MEPRPRRLPRLVAVAAMLTILGPGLLPHDAPASAIRTVRVFAIGYKHLLSDAASYDSYREHLRSLAAAADPGGPAQPGAPQKVFLFPEDSALYAMFTGLRGLPFRLLEPVLRRGGGNGASVAIAGLIAAYQPQAAFYRLKFPAANLSQARLGFLALTDTLYRSFFETFRSIAVAHRAWVVTSANIAPARITTNPILATLLGDPEARSRPCGSIPAPCAYEATTSNVYNQAFVFDPTGALVFNPFRPAREGDLDGAVKKSYLVPVEEGPIEQGKIGLDLSYGDLRQVRPIEIAGIPMGIVISKPAWMLDELGRLDAYGTRVMLQPEAFSSWGTPVEDWSPDVLKQSGWSHTQKYASFRYSVLSELTGNFFDLIFDAQNHIVEKATARSTAPFRYVGQPDDVGWEAVTPWVVGDSPGDPCDRDRLRARRTCLAEIARALAPASGSLRENGYVEGFLSSLLDLAPPPADPARAPGALGANARVDDAPPGARARNPHVASDGRGGRVVVWQDDRAGLDQIRIAHIDASGIVGPSRAVAPRPGVRQIAARVAMTAGGGLHVVWQELDPSPRLVRAYAPGADAPFAPPRRVGARLGADEQWTPAIAAGGNEDAHIGWIALRGGFERLAYSRITVEDGSAVETSSVLLDAEAFPAPEPLADRVNNRWNPSISARGDTVALAWTDFRNYSWDLFATVSRDGGRTFGSHRRVDDASRIAGASPSLERLQNDPSVSVMPDGAVVVAWTDQAGRRAGCRSCPQQRRPDADIAFARLAPRGTAFAGNIRVDDTGDGLATEDRIGFSNQWRPAIAIDPATGRLLAVWQDHRGGNNDIYVSASTDGGTTWGPNLRIDDTGLGVSNQYSPSLVFDAAGLTIVWQDDRDALDHIYMARSAA